MTLPYQFKVVRRHGPEILQPKSEEERRAPQESLITIERPEYVSNHVQTKNRELEYLQFAVLFLIVPHRNAKSKQVAAEVF